MDFLDVFDFKHKLIEKQGYKVISSYSNKIKKANNGGVKNINEEKALSNLARAKRSINEILTLNLQPNHTMFTLTYKENMQDYDKAYNDFKYFIKKLKVEYLVVKELQQRGAIHFHGVLFQELDYITINEAWGLGFVYVNSIDVYNVNAITNYFAKYVSNQSKGQMIDKNKRLYNTSRGVKRYKRQELSPADYFDLQNTTKKYTLFSNNVIKCFLPIDN